MLLPALFGGCTTGVAQPAPGPTSPALGGSPGSAGMAGTGGTIGAGGTPGTGGKTGTGGTATDAAPAPDTAPEAAAVDTSIPDAAAACSPTGGGPHWLEETGTVRVTLRCVTNLAAPGTAFTVASLPTGASYDPASATITFTPTLAQAAVYTVAVTHLPSGETGTLKIGVADKFDDPANDPRVDPLTYTEEHGLPVMHLAAAPTINAAEYTPATITYRGHVYSAEAQYRGASSLNYPKKNFTLRFAKDDKFNEPVFGDGFLARRKIVLITTFDDNSQVRARLAIDLWRRMDSANVAQKSFSGVVFLNGKYHGLYTFADKIDGNLMQRHGLREDANLYMAINHDANFAPFLMNEGTPQDESRQKISFEVGYEKKEGLPAQGEADAFSDIADLAEFVARSDDASFTAEIGSRIELRDYVNWLVHCTTLQAWDTLAKNSFHYHDAAAGTRWRVIPWDFNESFGQRWQTARFPTLVDPADVMYQPMGGFGYSNRDYLWRRLWAHPSFGPMIRARYGELLRGTLAVGEVLAHFDRLTAETAGAARRDERKWNSAYRSYYRRNDYTSYEQEVAYVRKWISDRWGFLTARY